MIYVAMYVGLTLLHFGTSGAVNLRRQLYFVVLVFLFVFSAFRYEVGCDWTGYYYQYLRAEFINFDDFSEVREFIWWGILSLQRYLGFSYPWANVVSSAVFFIGFHVLARRQPNPLAILVLIFPVLIVNMPMSGIRQGAAIGLLSIAYCAFIDRSLVKFVFWVVLAAGFHSSALIFLLLAPLVGVTRLSPTRVVLAALLAVPGAFLMASSSAADVAVDRYINSELEAFGAVFRVAVLALSGLFFFMFLRKPWQRAGHPDFLIASIGAFGMISVGVLLPVSSVIGDRLGYYLIPLQAMIFARIPYLPIARSRPFYGALPFAGLAIFFVVWTLNSGHFQLCYLPYQSWFFGFPGGGPFEF